MSAVQIGKTAADHSEYLEINGRLLKFVWAGIDWINLLHNGATGHGF